MSTRAVIIIKDDCQQVMLYRHSDGYPKCTGADLVEFIQGYYSGAMRDNVCQSAGWLIVKGHFNPDYHEKPNGKPTTEGYSGWKVGAYEPGASLGMWEEYIYIIDLEKKTLTCRVPGAGYDEKPSLKNTRACADFPTVSFAKLEVVA